jgi:hypothetical protein
MEAMGVPHFRIPVNLPHAATVAVRIRYFLQGTADHRSQSLLELLAPLRDLDQNPPKEQADPIVALAAGLARDIVAEIERKKAGHDRLGQAIRNLFECLGMGEEGAILSLRAGENPDSLLRPR